MLVQRRNILIIGSVHLFADSGGNIAHIFRVDIANHAHIFRVDIANQAGEGFSWTVCLHAGRQATFPKNARLGQMTM